MIFWNYQIIWDINHVSQQCITSCASKLAQWLRNVHVLFSKDLVVAAREHKLLCWQPNMVLWTVSIFFRDWLKYAANMKYLLKF